MGTSTDMVEVAEDGQNEEKPRNPHYPEPRRERGRPESRITRNSRAVGEKWILKGNRTPLEVMLRNMQYFDQKADELVRKADEWVSEPDSDEEWAERMKLLNAVKFNRIQAQDCARDAAPFMHPKLSSVDITAKDNKPWHILLGTGDDKL